MAQEYRNRGGPSISTRGRIVTGFRLVPVLDVFLITTVIFHTLIVIGAASRMSRRG